MNPIYLTGLPRSGSTLLHNILAQNPDFYVSHGTCPIPTILEEVKNTWHGRTITQSMPRETSYQVLQNILRAILYGSYLSDGPETHFITKSRGWLPLVETLNQISDEQPVKFIVTVRSVAEIMASMELQNRKARVLGVSTQEFMAPAEMLTLESRCNYWFMGNQVVGSAFVALRDAIEKGYHNQLHFVNMHDLTHSPNSTLESLYNFLEIPYFKHDFDNVEQVIYEDDRFHGFYDLHKIRPKVEPVEPKAISVIGETLTKKYNTQNQLWENLK